MSVGTLVALAGACAAFTEGEALRLRTVGVVSPRMPAVELQLSAEFDPQAFAFARARLDIVAPEGRFTDPSCALSCLGGSLAGSQVRDLTVSQRHDPGAGVIADSSNPIDLYRVRWTTDDFRARIIPVVTDTAVFDVYASAASPAALPRIDALREGFGLIRVVACYADCDADGALTFFDFACFLNAFGAGDVYADCDHSGAIDLFDFICFQNAFAAGCP